MPVTLGQKSPAAVGSFVHVAQPRFLIKHFFRIFGRHVEGKRNWSHPLSPTSRVTVQLPVELRNWYSDGCIYIYYIHLMLSMYVFFTVHLAVLKNKLDLEHVHQNSSSPDLARAQG